MAIRYDYNHHDYDIITIITMMMTLMMMTMTTTDDRRRLRRRRVFSCFSLFAACFSPGRHSWKCKPVQS